MTHPIKKNFVVFHRHPGQSNMLIIYTTAGQFKYRITFATVKMMMMLFAGTFVHRPGKRMSNLQQPALFHQPLDVAINCCLIDTWNNFSGLLQNLPDTQRLRTGHKHLHNRLSLRSIFIRFIHHSLYIQK